MERSWAVTGQGIVSAAGDTATAVYEHVAAGNEPAPRIEEFDPKRYIQRKGLKHLSRSSQLACAAASLVRPALGDLPEATVGVVLGSAWASLDSVVRFEREAHVDGVRFVDPLLFTETVANVPAGQVSIFFGWSAVNATVAGGTGAGIAAIEQALNLLDEERAHVIVAGGSDSFSAHVQRTLEDEGRAADTPEAAPLTGLGPLAAEGAALLAIESIDRATDRGATIHGRIRAASCRFHDPDRAGAEAWRHEFVLRLLDAAALNPRDIDLVVLSANGSPLRDAAEVRVVLGVFGDDEPAVIAPKAGLGETWAAGGALATCLAIEAMRRGTLPPVPDRVPDTAGLDVVRESRDRAIAHALVVDCAENGRLSGLVVSSGGENPR